jgi:hypothetical protein
VELGPEFVHGDPPETWGVIRAARLPVVQIDGERWRAAEHGRVVRADAMAEMDAVLEQLDPDRDPDRSFQHFLDASGFTADDRRRRMAQQYVEGFHAADPADASERSIARAENASGTAGGEHQSRVISGYSSVVRWLADGLDPERSALRLGTVVRAVRWSAGAVALDLASVLGTPLPVVQAPRALITLPLGVLQAPPSSAGAVLFSPALPPAKQEAITLLRAGSVVRLVMRFRHRFWVDDPPAGVDDLSRLTFLHSEDPWFPVMWTAYPVAAPLLVAWAGGPRARALSTLDEPALVGRALDALAASVGRPRAELEALLEGWYTHDWTGDPYARGAYSYAAVGGADAPQALGAPVDDTLYFAGEATVADGDIGTVHGAMRSGRRAAAELLAARG